MATVNETLLDLSIRHQVGVQRLSAGIARSVRSILSKAEEQIVAKLASRQPTLEGSFTSQRLGYLLQAIRQINKDAHVSFGKELRGELRDLAKYESAFQGRMLANSIPVQVDVVSPSARMLNAVVTDKPFQGRVLKDWVKDLEAGSYKRLQGAVQQGIVQGKTSDEIIRAVRGTKALGFKDGVMQVSRRHAENLVRTATNHTANAAREALYAENADLIGGVGWAATLDTRTCVECMGREEDGPYPIDSGPRPPEHPSCRCTTYPVTKTWRQMGIDVDEAPPGTRASMDGQVPETMSYQSWLSSQPAAVQDEALGPTRAALFRDGDLTVDRFTDSRGNALTLDQLEKRETEAFEKADIESAKPATAPEPEPVPEPEATPIAEDELLKAAEEPAPGPEPVLSIDQIIRSQSETDNALYERAESLPRGSDYLSLGRHGFSGGGSIDLSPLERQALSSYQGIGFEDINKALRQQVNMEGVDFDSEIVPIDRAMQKSVLDKDIRVWRGVWDYKQTYGVDDIEDLVGAEIKDLGYLSTSTDRNVAEEFVSFGDETNKKALLLEIAAPKGSRAVHMLEATGEASGEREILFDRGSKFRILRVEKNPDSAVRMKLIAVLVQ